MRIGRAHCGVGDHQTAESDDPFGYPHRIAQLLGRHADSGPVHSPSGNPRRGRTACRPRARAPPSVSRDRASRVADGRSPCPDRRKRLRESPAAAFSRLSVIVHSMRAIRVVSWGFVVRTVAASRSIEEESRGERREACRISASASRRSSPANESEALLVIRTSGPYPGRQAVHDHPSRARIRPRSRFLSAERRQAHPQLGLQAFRKGRPLPATGKSAPGPSSPPRTSYGTRRADRPAGSSPRHRPEYRCAHP